MGNAIVETKENVRTLFKAEKGTAWLNKLKFTTTITFLED